MCLLLIACGVSSRHPLVVAANRDEFRERPTAPAGFWPEATDVLAGRDLRSGGTWLGVSRSGRFAAVTNVREARAARRGTRSRGLLVSGFLEAADPPEDFLARTAREADDYDGFNLIAGSSAGLWWLSNRAPEARAVPIAPGVHGISNALLDTPWPKLAASREKARAILDGDAAAELPERLFELLADDARFEDAHLPDTGVGLEWERVLSSAFIDTPEYGTRASTVVLFHRDGRIDFEERTHESGARATSARRFTLAPRERT